MANTSSTDGDEHSSSNLTVGDDSLGLGRIGAVGSSNDEGDDTAGAITSEGLDGSLGDVLGTTASSDGDETSSSVANIGGADTLFGGFGLGGSSSDEGDDTNGVVVLGDLWADQRGGTFANAAQDGDEASIDAYSISGLELVREGLVFDSASRD